MFLLINNFVESSHTEARIFLMILKTTVNQTWKAFNTKFSRQRKDRKSSYPGRETFALFCNLIALTLG